jgi:hypothetical protein
MLAPAEQDRGASDRVKRSSSRRRRAHSGAQTTRQSVDSPRDDATQPSTSAHSTALQSRIRRLRTGYLNRAQGLIATISALLGLLALIDALLPRERERVQTLTLIIPIPATETAAAITAVSGLLLLRVAAALRKRKRRAWRLAAGHHGDHRPGPRSGPQGRPPHR